jgi:hypothetical protein
LAKDTLRQKISSGSRRGEFAPITIDVRVAATQLTLPNALTVTVEGSKREIVGAELVDGQLVELNIVDDRLDHMVVDGVRISFDDSRMRIESIKTVSSKKVTQRTESYQGEVPLEAGVASRGSV